MSEHKLSILVEALGTASANKKLKGVDKTISNIGARGGQGIRTAATNLVKLGTVAAGAAAVGLVGAVKAATDFQSQMNTINTVALIKDPKQLEAVGQGIRDTAKKSGQSLTDLTQAYYDLLSAGIKVEDAQSVLNQSVTLGIGALGTTTETVDLLTTAINAYGLDSKGAAIATDQFAQAVADGKVTVSEISATFSNVAPLAKTFGVGIDQISAAYGYLTAQGVPAAEVTTQMSRSIQDIVKPTGKAAKAMDILAKQTGVDWKKMLQSKGLVPTLEAMRVAAQKANIPFQNLFGRKEGLLFALQTTGPKFNGFVAEQARVLGSSGMAAEQAQQRMQGLGFSLSRLKNYAIDAGITIGNKLLPKLEPLAKKAVDFLDSHQADISAFGDKIAAGFDKALAFAKKIPWDAIGTGLQTAAEWGGRLMDLFSSMPPEVQSTIIALAGLNKLSGGAISGIVGELGKGLIKGVLGINAGVVNVRGAVVNGGGGGIPGAAGAAGGAGLVATAAAAGAVAALGAAGTAALVYGIPAAVEAIYGKNPAGAMQTGGARTSAGKQSALTVQMFKGLMPSYVANIKAAGATALRSSKGTPHQAEPAAVYQPIKTSVLELQRKNETVGHAQQERIDSLKSTTAAKLDSVRSAITSAGRQVPQVSTNVTVNISAAGLSKTVTTHSRYGSPNGSYGSGSPTPHGAVL